MQGCATSCFHTHIKSGDTWPNENWRVKSMLIVVVQFPLKKKIGSLL
jgi:hypothetical protein